RPGVPGGGGPSRGLRRRAGAARGEPAGGRGRHLRDPRAERRGQDDAAAGPVRDAPRAGDRPARRGSADGAAAGRGGAARRGARPRGARHVHAADGRGEPAARRVRAAGPGRGAGRPRAGVRPLPGAEGAGQAGGGQPQRRRAADARDRACADVAAAAAAAGRAVPRPGPDGDQGAVRHRPIDQPGGAHHRGRRGTERPSRAGHRRAGACPGERPDRAVGLGGGDPGRRAGGAGLPRIPDLAMADFVQQFVGGLGAGAIYASLALALVLIYQFTGIVNFAQGELAMFSTYIAWTFLDAGLPFWLALVLTLAISFVGGMLIERVIIRPVEGAPELTLVIVTVGLFIFVNAAAGWIWTFLIKDFPNPFPGGALRAGGVSLSYSTLGVLAVVGGVMGLLYLLFRYTKVGLGMRAVATNPDSARLVGIRVGWTLALGWGLASLVGAVSGVLVAPLLFLEPNMMGGVLIYAFAAATLGGFDSPLGAVVGGLFVGVAETLAGSYVDFIGSDLKIGVPLAIILGVLLLRPQGLFGRAAVERA